jgi:hypothetical protein
MKHIVAIAFVVLFAPVAEAQDVCPEFANSLNLITEDGKAKELPLERAIARQKKKGIYRGYHQSIRLEGAAAKNSVKSNFAFAFKPFHTNVHPRQQIKLYPFESSKGYRELITGGTTHWGGSKDRKSGEGDIPLEFEKIKDGCYKVKPQAQLPPGEYAFSLAGTSTDSGAAVQGTSAGYGESVGGQTWFGFTVKK